jgi:hypothetical protein
MSQLQFTMTVGNYMEKLQSEKDSTIKELNELNELIAATEIQVEEYTELFNGAMVDYFDSRMIVKFYESIMNVELNPIQRIMEELLGITSYKTRSIVKEMNLPESYATLTLSRIKEIISNMKSIALDNDDCVYSRLCRFNEFSDLHTYMHDDTIETYYNRRKNTRTKLDSMNYKRKKLKEMIDVIGLKITNVESYDLNSGTKITITI